MSDDSQNLPSSPSGESSQAEASVEEVESPSSSSSRSFTEESNDSWSQPALTRSEINAARLEESPAAVPTRPLDLGNRRLKGKHFVNDQGLQHASPRPISFDAPDHRYSMVLPVGRHSLLNVKTRLQEKAYRFWKVNRSYLLVIISTFFGSFMTLLTKLLESQEQGMHAFQILFFRMTISWVICAGFLYKTKPAEFPFGPKDVKWLLLTRGVFGFVGIGGLWTGLNYLNLSDATVITFLTPSMIAAYSAIFLNEPFPRKEVMASCVAMLGVVFIARPVALFGTAPTDNITSPVTSSLSDRHPVSLPTITTTDAELKQATQRLMGIALCVASAIGGAGALLSVKRIGTRASVLTTTSYFALICTLVTFTTLLLAPALGLELRFAFPHSATQWLYIGAITACGLATQLLMTLGVGGDGRSNKAPAMLYTGMLWTAVFDRMVFGKNMHWTSVVGCGLIVGGAVFIALQPKAQPGEMLLPVVMEDVADGAEPNWVAEMESFDSDSDT